MGARSWNKSEPDLFLARRVRRTVAAAREEAQATAADVATASLILHAEVAAFPASSRIGKSLHLDILLEEL
jgi:hypothetical protein